jgi:hypothetical protein
MGGLVRKAVRAAVGLLVLWSVGALVGAIVAKRRLRPSGGPDDDEVALVAILEPLEFVSLARAFRGGSLMCWFGGGDVDLRGATLDPAGARLSVTAIFGGGRILVPAGWQVTHRVVSIFGGVGDTRSEAEHEADAPTLVLDGVALFGGFAIHSDAGTGDRETTVPAGAEP